MIWFSVFEASATDFDENLGGTLNETIAGAGPAVALFGFLAEYPLAIVTSLLALFLIYIFFVAGADAGTIVLGSMSSGGVLNPKRAVKLTWGVIMAALAAILLLAGGGGSDALNGLTNGAILAATPFGILMVPMCYGLYKTLKTDYREERREIQEALAYDRDAERRQFEEIKTGQPSRLRRVRVPQATADRPTSNGNE